MRGSKYALQQSWALSHTTWSAALALYAAHATSSSRASPHLLLTRVTLPVREPPARGAAGQARHFYVRTAGCAWSREVKHAFNSFSSTSCRHAHAHTYMHFRVVLLFMQINVRYAI